MKTKNWLNLEPVRAIIKAQANTAGQVNNTKEINKMGFVSGLASINDTLSKRGGGDFEERVKATYVSLKGGESVKVRPLQELDEGSPNYSEKNGLGIFSLQHSNPDNWKKNAECTTDEGECYGCARGWRQKVVMYVNVLVEDGTNDPYVAVLSRGVGKGSIANSLIQMAGDEDYNNSISDKQFKFSRTGSTKDDTTYTLNALPKAPTGSVEDYELFDLSKIAFHVKPERQEAYYLDLADGESAAKPAKAPVSPSSIDADW